MKRCAAKGEYVNKAEVFTTDVVVVGSGIAGLFAAMGLASCYDVTVLTKAAIERSSTEEAQGGIAAALLPEDSPEVHFRDTLKAGAGICNEEAVRVMTRKGPQYVRDLMAMGVDFDRVQGELDFVREAAHTYRRVLHAGGDMTGQAIQRQLAYSAQREGLLRLEENCCVIDLLKNADNHVVGVLALAQGRLKAWRARAVVLATGGMGQIYRYTSNPEMLTGDGMAAALRAGAELMNMEFIQFHPTVFLKPDGTCFLISEAVRGDGARLLNERGEFFMDRVPGKELAPRDVVARAIWDQLKEGPVFLDFSAITHKNIREGFPKIYATCLKSGVDIERQPVPVMPAAHYCMGGIRTDISGRTGLRNLFACGECACNGVHGANRLASNSLLDGLVFGSEAALALERYMAEEMPGWESVVWPCSPGSFQPSELGGEDVAALRGQLTDLMWNKVGIIRDEEGLWEALACLEGMETGYQPELETGAMRKKESCLGLRKEVLELGNLLVLGRGIVLSALSRRESRGAHYRSDYPERCGEFRKNSVYKRGNDGVESIEFRDL
ncbi:MAG: L-aspartate oxidase [Peptococcaceae bacterium]|nr:L-aspartate oxidase [Peptococcaceae bacterium]